MRDFRVMFLSASCLAGLAMIGAYEAGASPCAWVQWDSQQPTSVQCKGDRSFSYNLYTSTYSDFNSQTFDYVLILQYNTGLSQHIQNHNMTPGSWDVYETAAYGPSTCSGTLESEPDSGSFVTDAFDSPNVDCTGRWTVSVLK